MRRKHDSAVGKEAKVAEHNRGAMTIGSGGYQRNPRVGGAWAGRIGGLIEMILMSLRQLRSASVALLLLLLLVLSFPEEARGLVIWRCPEFNVLNCKQLPKHCSAFRMIYIRHGDLECPGCLICADAWAYEPWPIYEKVQQVKVKVKVKKIAERRERKKLKRKLRKRRRRARLRLLKWKGIKRLNKKVNDISTYP